MPEHRFPHQATWKSAIASRFDPKTAKQLWLATRAKYVELSHIEKHPTAAEEHLAAIVPSIALHLSARDIGLPTDLSLDIIHNVAMQNAKAKARFMKVLKHVPGAFRLFRFFSPRILKRDYAKAGFEVEWIEESQNRIAFNIKKCLYVDLFRKYDCVEIGPIYCRIDDYWYEPLAPTIHWTRTGTLASGASCCDFRFLSKSGVEED